MLVVKVGGSLLKNGFPENIAEDIASLTSSGERIVLVHGGGDIVTDIASKLGKEQKFIISPEGIRSRYTDKETAEIYTMVMTGLIRNKIVSALQRHNIAAAGLSGVDCMLMRAKRKSKLLILDSRGRKVMIEGGYTGTIVSVNSELLLELASKKILPVISPVAIGEDFEFLNVDGDRAASSIASSLSSDYLMLLTNVEGLILEGKVVREISPANARARLKEIGFGMQKKVIAAAEAVEKGVKCSVICSGLEERAITRALKGELGTVVKNG